MNKLYESNHLAIKESEKIKKELKCFTLIVQEPTRGGFVVQYGNYGPMWNLIAKDIDGYDR